MVLGYPRNAVRPPSHAETLLFHLKHVDIFPPCHIADTRLCRNVSMFSPCFIIQELTENSSTVFIAVSAFCCFFFLPFNLCSTGIIVII